MISIQSVPHHIPLNWKVYMAKSIIVVGAGIAGLSTGGYACLNRYKTTLFEMHTISAVCAPPGSEADVINNSLDCFHRQAVTEESFHIAWIELS